MRPILSLLLFYFLLPPGSISQRSLQPLTDGANVSFSPTGKKIAYEYHQQIWIADASGKNARQVTSLTVMNYHPAWSPDGNKLAFQCMGTFLSGKYEIWTINVDGTCAKKLIGGSDRFPFWSPDGKQIVWTHGNQLWIMDSSGSHQQALTPNSARAFEYVNDWSSKLGTIVYLAREDNSDAFLVRLIRPDGKDQRTLGTNRALAVKCSKLGSDLYYSDGHAVWRVSTTADSAAVKVYQFNVSDEVRNFDISPDERWLVFSAGGQDDTEEEIFRLQWKNPDSK